MQKLKRQPLLKRLGSTLSNLLPPVDKLLTFHVKLPKWTMTAVWTGLLLLACWMLFGCTTQTRTVRPPLPPQADARPMPRFLGSTYRDSIQYTLEVREWGMGCEADKTAIRRMYKAPAK